jgi:hypothetical protein
VKDFQHRWICFKPKAYQSKGPPLRGVGYAETQHSKDRDHNNEAIVDVAVQREVAIL